MIRPESVAVVPGGSGAIVTEREFYGHDQLVTLQMRDGRRLLSRIGPYPVVSPGDEVGFSVTDVVAFEAPCRSRSLAGGVGSGSPGPWPSHRPPSPQRQW